LRLSIPLLLTVAIAFLQHASPVNAQPVVEQNIQADSVSVDSIIKKTFSIDSLFSVPDSFPTALELITKFIPISSDTIDAEVHYTAEDSIIYNLEEKKVHLYGNATANYKTIQLKSDYIVFDWATSTLSAEVNKDSMGNPVGYAEFKEGEGSYKAKKLSYNFKTTKGKVYTVLTQEGEGYIHSEAVKKNENGEWYGYKGKYTTCDLEHPHFYFRANKMKVVPDKVIVTGPVNLVIEDVPLPIYLPFAIFPIKKGQRSGILFPEYGEERNRGFFLRNGGYYFGISEYIDLAVRGDIYTKGSWAVKAASNYRKRYKFNGNVNMNFGRNRLGEPESPDFDITNDFRVNWNHTQEAKTALNSRFAANVNFGSSSYDKNFSPGDKERVLNSALASKISYSKSWAGKPFSFSMNLAHDQNLNTGIINLQLPVLAFGVSRIQPFELRNKVSSKPKWYESIGFSYNFDAENIINGVDSTFLEKETFRNARYGIRHSLPISASFKMFKYFTLAPRINYTERWYFQTINKKWDPTTIIDGSDTTYGTVLVDTLLGFKAARDFNFGASFTTKLFGQLNFRGKLKAIRHVFTPSINFNYTPDFGTEFWGYYKDVQADTAGNIETYSVFDIVRNVYGAPPTGTIGSIGFLLGNVLEMKVFSKKDTVKNEKKIKLLESFNISSSYNLAADSLNLAPFNFNGRASLVPGKLDFYFVFVLDPYKVDSNNRRINTFVIENDKRLTRLTSTNFTLNARFQSKKTGETASQPNANITEEEREMIEQNRDLYYDFNIPWSFNFSYNMGLRRGIPGNTELIDVSRNSVDFDFDANITPKWKMNLSTGYDLKDMELVLTTFSVIRDLHCWVLRFDWTPFPIHLQRYAIQLNVKSHILQDMKLTKRKEQFDNVF